LITLGPELPHYLTRIEWQEDAPLTVAPDGCDTTGVCVEDRLGWFPFLAKLTQHGWDAGAERDMPEECATP
jgi:hypothetical protein